jgi:hypothetical protein
MELLDRYLQAVKKHLPWQRQDDIIAELRANLESQLEEKESALGRPLTPAEAEDWFKQLGSPLQVAAAYKPQQYLIGPAIFPTYWYVMRLVLSWALFIYSIVTVVKVFTGPQNGAALLDAALHLPLVLMTIAAWVTFTFAAFEFAVSRQYIKLPAIVPPSAPWSLAGLPPLSPGVEQGIRPRTFAQAVVEVVFGFLLLAWIMLIPQHPYLLMGPGAVYLKVSPFQLAPVWWQFYWWIVALNLIQLGWRSVQLLRGAWAQSRRVEHLVVKAFGLIPVVILLTVRDHALVFLKNPIVDQAQYGATMESINHWASRGFLIILAIASLQLIWDIMRIILDHYRNRAAAML